MTREDARMLALFLTLSVLGGAAFAALLVWVDGPKQRAASAETPRQTAQTAQAVTATHANPRNPAPVIAITPRGPEPALRLVGRGNGPALVLTPRGIKPAWGTWGAP